MKSVGKGGSGSGELQSDLLDRSTATVGGDGWLTLPRWAAEDGIDQTLQLPTPLTEDIDVREL